MREAQKSGDLEGLVRRVRSGDQIGLEKLYLFLSENFGGLALRLLGDAQEAQTAFNDAFMAFCHELQNGFTWQGEFQFYRYFATTLKNKCRDLQRGKKHRQKIQEIVNEELVGNYEEPFLDWEPELEGAEKEREIRLREEMQKFLENRCSSQERRFWEAYKALSEIPGSDQWRPQEKTAFLKAYLEMPESAFYPAHSRFKGKLEALAKELGLLR